MAAKYPWLSPSSYRGPNALKVVPSITTTPIRILSAVTPGVATLGARPDPAAVVTEPPAAAVLAVPAVAPGAAPGVGLAAAGAWPVPSPVAPADAAPAEPADGLPGEDTATDPPDPGEADVTTRAPWSGRTSTVRRTPARRPTSTPNAPVGRER